MAAVDARISVRYISLDLQAFKTYRYPPRDGTLIRGFRDAKTRAVFEGRCPKGFPADIFKIARRKLGYLDAAVTLASLASPPGNGLHALEDDRMRQHAIKVNDQYRICFRWTAAGPDDVEFVDYH